MCRIVNMEKLARSLLVSLVAMLSAAGASLAADPFTRGDVDQSGRIAVVDAIRILEHLFRGGDPPSCEDAADVDDDGSLTIVDPIVLVQTLFQGRLPPPAPFPGCGEDPTEDGLSCEAFEACRFTFTFYGQELSADAVIFVIDRSGTIQTAGELQRAKTEILRGVDAMPDGTRFAILFFDASLVRFPVSPEPAIASDETKASARTFVNQMQGGSGTCGGTALLRAIEFARLSGARRKLILYVSDGGGTCAGMDERTYLERTLNETSLANSGLARIYTFGILDPVGEFFLQDLADQNGGIFVRA